MTKSHKGHFITFEGGEGTGKTTQIKTLGRALEAGGHDVVLTREPGGSPGAETIRNLLVTGDTDRWEPATEALLHFAARNEHLSRIVRPALEKGAIVLCDRFSDSTMAYQGMVQGLGEKFVEALDALIVDETPPDLTLIFDLDPAIGLTRAGERSNAQHGSTSEDRYERMGQAFHEKLRTAFLDIAANNPGRCHIVDGAGTIDEVSSAIGAIVTKTLGLP